MTRRPQPGRRRVVLHLSEDVRDALHLRKVLTKTDLSRTVEELLTRELAQELALVRQRRPHPPRPGGRYRR